MTAPIPPVPLVGDGLMVPCVDGIERPYLSLDAAASTSTLPSVFEMRSAMTTANDFMNQPKGLDDWNLVTSDWGRVVEAQVLVAEPLL